MSKKIFVSYKYSDSSVRNLTDGIFGNSTARDYVDELQLLLEENDEINKGEQDGEDLSDFQNSTIASKLRDKIYDSSITIVVVSKGMKNFHAEKDQWIPWEVSYSLKEHTRNGRTSQTNAMLALVLPDENDSYEYYIVDNTCTKCNCRTLKTDMLFKVIENNMFNAKQSVQSDCDNHSNGSNVYIGDHSYINSVKWSDFKVNVSWYLDEALRLNEKISEFDITKSID